MPRIHWRRLRMGLLTVLGIARQGFFIPYRYADTLPGPGERQGYETITPFFEAAAPEFTALLAAMADYADELSAIGCDAPPQPRWNQDWFPRLDAAIAYTLVRRQAPARIVEVGSGHSTRFLARAVRDGGLATVITSIDPAPRAALAGLPVQRIDATLGEAGLAPFRALAAGDVLFIDSSHILMPGSDVDVALNLVLPALPAGVLVHFHDIFLPQDYPLEWAWRGYNEQNGVASLLTSGAYEAVFSSRFATTAMPGSVASSPAATLPINPGVFETSLWLRKR